MNWIMIDADDEPGSFRLFRERRPIKERLADWLMDQHRQTDRQTVKTEYGLVNE